MHCGSLERNGTQRKRTLSRGMSEDESIRHIIKEAEETTKRLTRSDSRYGSLKRGERCLSQSGDDSLAGIPDMVELQANYDNMLLELREMEVQRETLLFQVDVLQDALLTAEEMLAEAHREQQDTSMELDREREARRKLEDMVSSLMQEVERLKEERNSIPAVPVYTLVRDGTQETATEATEDTQTSPPPSSSSPPPTTTTNETQTEAPFTLVRLDSTPVGETPAPSGQTAPAWLQNAPLGTSVDQEPEQVKNPPGSPSEGPLAKLTRMVKSIGQSPSLELSEHPAQEGVFRGQGRGKQAGEDADDNDESSGYEDAQSELQEQLPGASTPDMSPDAGFLDGEEAADEEGQEAEEDGGSPKTGDTGSPKPNDSCVVS